MVIDLRIIAYLEILHLMQAEGARVAFNKSRADFATTVNEW